MVINFLLCDSENNLNYNFYLNGHGHLSFNCKGFMSCSHSSPDLNVIKMDALIEFMFLTNCRVVPIGEASVIIAVSSAHRKNSLEAVQYCIDTLKATVPIWKKV